MAADPGRVVAAASDGACSGNPGPGGWGALLRFEDGSVIEMGGAEAATTNNRMELTAALAVLEALKDLPLHPDLELRTDSRYLIDGLTRWMPAWKRRGWRTASGSPVLNRDLWEALDGAKLPGVPLAHVRGHSGDPDNDRCDAIAVAFSKGEQPVLSAGERASADPPPKDPPPDPRPDPQPKSEAAPADLARLLTRMELADRLAAGGYGLSGGELARLVELPLARVAERQGDWQWRDWRVYPCEEGRWRLERVAPGSEASEALALAEEPRP